MQCAALISPRFRNLSKVRVRLFSECSSVLSPVPFRTLFSSTWTFQLYRWLQFARWITQSVWLIQTKIWTPNFGLQLLERWGEALSAHLAEVWLQTLFDKMQPSSENLSWCSSSATRSCNLEIVTWKLELQIIPPRARKLFEDNLRIAWYFLTFFRLYAKQYPVDIHQLHPLRNRCTCAKFVLQMALVSKYYDKNTIWGASRFNQTC